MLLKELIKRLENSDPQLRYSMVFMYEWVNEQQKQLDMLTNVSAMLAEQNSLLLNRLGELQAATAMKGAAKDLQDFGKTQGVDVRSESVLDDPSLS